jgi:ApbE superfamily uncharacterized protein (UPF0280 family)
MTKRAWSETVSAKLLPDGRRLHLQHGPIDLIIEACGEDREIAKAYDQALAAFKPVLADLVSELPRLRSADGPVPRGEVARVMWAATSAFASDFITPMAAVAGSVADHILKRMTEGRALTRAYVNNGGDIALHLSEGTFRIGICDDPVTGRAGGFVQLRPEDGVGGIATSGWRGRSHSLGIADAVTVLAETAAQADAAATMIANKINLPGSAKIIRKMASDLSPDTDLGDRLVTTDVRDLSMSEIHTALASGEQAAQAYLACGLFQAAYLSLARERRIVAAPEAEHLNQNAITNIREAACA